MKDGIMLRSLPPTGAPLQGEDILSGLRSVWSGDDPIEQFKVEIRRYLGTGHCFLLSSGKAALTVALHALSRVSARQEVIIPGFSSFCLPSAVAKAGLRIRLCDVSPETLDFDLDKLNRIITEQTLCVIPVHLFGLSSQVDVVRQMAKAHGAYVIEDAAQAAGGRLNGKKLGTMGDIGIFSLGRGKSVTTVEGGIIVTESPSLAEEIQRCLEMSTPEESSTAGQVLAAVKALTLSVFLRPGVYWFPERLPFLKLGASEFSTGFDIRGFSRFQAGMGSSVFAQLDHYNEIRRSNAAYLMDQLKGMDGIRMPQPLLASHPVYLRFPLLAEDPAVRRLAYRTLAEQGLGASTTYPTALSAIRDLRPYAVGLDASYPGAEWVADRILTLPTHPYVTRADLEHIIRVLRSLSKDSPPASLFEKEPTVQSRSLERGM
jgi:perosamine synthetase